MESRANGRLGDERNGVEGTVGVGLGVGFGLDVNRSKNDDGTATTSFSVDAALIGKVGFGATYTTEPSAGLKGPKLAFTHPAAAPG